MKWTTNEPLGKQESEECKVERKRDKLKNPSWKISWKNPSKQDAVNLFNMRKKEWSMHVVAGAKFYKAKYPIEDLYVEICVTGLNQNLYE